MLLEQVINGFVVGSMYALIALGFCLVFGVLDKLNFAHPELFMLAGYLAIALMGMGAPVLVTIPLVVLVIGLGGLAVEWVSFRKFVAHDSHITAALSSLALGLVIIDGVQKIWGSEPLQLPAPTSLRTASISLGDLQISWLKIVTLAATFVLMVFMHHLITRTQLGRNIRATADSSEAAQLLGIDVRKVTQQTFFIASALAAIAGVMLVFRTGFATTESGFNLGLKALAILAIGGMSDLKGAVVGGLLVGVVEALAIHFGLGKLAGVAVWAFMIAVLMFKPTGLFGSGHSRTEARA